MLGVLVNALAILAGGSVGLLAKKGIPEKITNAIMTAIALCVIYIGVSGMLKGENTLVLIVSMVLGTAVGTLLDLDGRIERLGGRIERRFQRGGKRTPIAEGFVTASLLFCVGAMAILGSFNAGLKQDYELLFTKSLLDGISSCMLSVSLGLGVLFSSVPVFVYQGLLALLAHVIAPLLSDAAIAEITCCGSVMILAIGLNMLHLTKIKTADLLPAVLFAPVPAITGTRPATASTAAFTTAVCSSKETVGLSPEVPIETMASAPSLTCQSISF